MTLGRWRLWYVLGMTLLVLSGLIGLRLFRDGDLALIWSAVIAITGVTVLVVSSWRRRPTEKQEAAERAAAGPDPQRWRVVESDDDK